MKTHINHSWEVSYRKVEKGYIMFCLHNFPTLNIEELNK
jgi:hypothetical protein